MADVRAVRTVAVMSVVAFSRASATAASLDRSTSAGMTWAR